MHHWKEKYNFKIGHPPDETSQIETFKKAINHTFERINDKNEDMFVYRFLNYGEKKGDKGLRNAIAKWVSEDTFFKVYPEHVFTTNGCSHGLDLLCTALLKNGDNILVEAPTYYIMLNTFNDHKLNTFSVMKNENDGTLDLENIEKIIKEKDIKAFYLIATCHNPTNLNLPLEQRNAIYNLALKYKCYIIVDDVYEKFFYNGEKNRLPPVFYCSDDILSKKDKYRKEILDFDPNSNPYVISMNSFNKLINPGFRLGWIMAHEDIIKRLEAIGYIASGGGVNSTLSQFVRSFIELGLIDEAIDFTHKNFQDRIDKCDEVLKGSKAYDYIKPEGGYFYWLRLNDKVNLSKLKDRLQEEDTVILFGDTAADCKSLSEKEVEHLQRRIRLCFTRYETDRMISGFKFVRQLIEECLES